MVEHALSAGHAFLGRGQLDEAVDQLRSAMTLQPADATIRSLFWGAVALRRERNRELARRKVVGDHTVLKCLGVGQHGVVYLARNRAGRKCVVKVLHAHTLGPLNDDRLPGTTPHVPLRRSRDVLVALSRHLQHAHSQVDALYPFQLLEHNGRIGGFVYQYERLIRIHGRHLALPDVATSIIGALFRTQAYLGANLGLCLIDAHLGNFMITATGRVRYIDYGRSFEPTDGRRCLEDHLALVELLRLLYQLYRPEYRSLVDSSHLEVALDDTTGLGTAAARHDWMRTILSSINAGRYGHFLDPDYYLYLSAGLPRKVGLVSQSAILVLDSLAGVRRAWASPWRA